MLFVQEEVFDSLSKDVKDNNKIDISIDVSSSDLNKLKSEYASKTDLISKNKETYSVAKIIKFIGEKKTFSK